MLLLPRRTRIVATAALSVLAACGAPAANSGDVGEPASTDTDLPEVSAPSGASESSWMERNAALDRVTLDVWADGTVELDMATVGGFDLLEAAPPVRQRFCAAASVVRIAWIDGAVIPVQYWFDSFLAVDDTPPHIADDVDLLLEHGAQRIAWNLRRADEPIVDNVVAGAAHRIVSEAAVGCTDFPELIGREPTDPWVEGSFGADDPVGTCNRDRADVAVAVDRYVELAGESPRHLEQVEALLLGDTEVRFFGSELHRLTDDETSIVPFVGGACDVS